MDNSNLVLTTLTGFLDQLGFAEKPQVTLNFDSQNDLYQILIQTSNPGPIIGYHGETLSALQILVGQHLHTQTESWLNLSINVNDYRERRESTLKSLADAAVSQVLHTNTPHSLPPMPAGERRIIHLYLGEHPEVVTSSQGEGRNRYIVISPKNAG